MALRMSYFLFLYQLKSPSKKRFAKEVLEAKEKKKPRIEVRFTCYLTHVVSATPAYLRANSGPTSSYVATFFPLPTHSLQSSLNFRRPTLAL